MSKIDNIEFEEMDESGFYDDWYDYADWINIIIIDEDGYEDGYLDSNKE